MKTIESTGCTGPCEEGRRRCPTPEACEYADSFERDALEMLGRLLITAMVVVVVVAVWWGFS